MPLIYLERPLVLENKKEKVEKETMKGHKKEKKRREMPNKRNCDWPYYAQKKGMVKFPLGETRSTAMSVTKH